MVRKLPVDGDGDRAAADVYQAGSHPDGQDAGDDGLVQLQMPRRKWTVLAASEKCNSTRTMPTTWARRVATAAPVMPHLNQKMKMGARMMLIPTERRVEPMAF